ncbi:hypothetical protein ACTWPX_19785 [Halobacillus sp. H74]
MIIGNAGLAIITVFSLTLIMDRKLVGVVIFLALWLVYDYIKWLQDRAKIDQEHKRKGLISYFVTGIAAFLIYFL